MTERQRRTKILEGALNPTFLREVGHMTNALNAHNEETRRIMNGPMEGVQKFIELFNSQQESWQKMIKATQLPKLDLLKPFSDGLGNIPMVYSPPLRRVRIDHAEESASGQSAKYTQAVLRLATAQEESNVLLKKMLNRQDRKRQKQLAQMIVLSPDGSLFVQRHPRTRLDLSKARLQKQILSALESTYIPTKELILLSHAGSDASFSRTIGSLNRRITKKFKLKRPLIENTPGLGYRIDPVYTLIKE